MAHFWMDNSFQMAAELVEETFVALVAFWPRNSGQTGNESVTETAREYLRAQNQETWPTSM